MSSISVSSETKDEFDKLKPEDMTHDEGCGANQVLKDE